MKTYWLLHSSLCSLSLLLAVFNWYDMQFWQTALGDRLVHEGDALPRVEHRTRAFDLTPFHEVKVVILGQDPYHTRDVADGLAFSTWPHIQQRPPSLRNIFQEYTRDLDFPDPRTNSLETWARNGVLLLNTALSVLESKPGSRMDKGWERLTLEVFKHLQSKRSGIVYMLWGKKAQEYAGRVDVDSNLLLTAGHPSPLNRTNTFAGCSHFTKACTYLNQDKSFWRLP